MPNPATEASPSVELSERVKSWLKDNAQAMSHDLNDRSEWVDWMDYFERRRFCQEFRNPEWPWPGSADIVMPLIDKTIKKSTPRFYQTLLHERPMSALAMDRDSQKNSPNVEMMLQYLIRDPSTKYLRETAYHLDDLNTMGFAFYKTYWAYERRPSAMYLRRDKLPQRLQSLVVVKNEAEANVLAMQAAASGQQAAVMTKKEFKQNADLVRQTISGAFDLTDSPIDRKAVEKIMGWFGDGAEKPMTVKVTSTLINQPAAVAPSPYDVIFPQDTTDIQEAERIMHRMTLGRNQLVRVAMNNGWDMKVLEEILKEEDRDEQSATGAHRGMAEDMREQSERDRFHLSDDSTDSQTFFEVHTWLSRKQYGPQEKVSYIVHRRHLDRPLKIKVNSSPSGRFPFHVSRLESHSRRIMGSRGLPQLLNDIDAEITMVHRARLNRAQISTSPSFAYRPGSGFNPDMVNWMPGAFYPFQRPGQDVVPLATPPMDNFELQEEQFLRTWAEELAGSTDFGLTNPLSQTRDARTAKEIGAITDSAALSSIIAGSDFAQTQEEVADEWFDAWHTFGPNQIWVARTSAAPMMMTKADLAGNFRFNMASNITEGGPQARAQQALSRFATLLQVGQAAGVKYELDLGEALRDWLEKEDPRFVARVMRERTPQEIQQIVQKQQRDQELARKALTNQKMSMDDLAEATQLLKKDAPFKQLQSIDMASTLEGVAKQQ